jgi:hypothetical protein
MRPRATNHAYRSPADSDHTRRGGGAVAISARHQLLSDSWTADVEALEEALGRLRTDGNLTNNCEVVCFEIAGDEHLHVNVTHEYATKAVKGWAGPGMMPDGVVHNRRFGATPQSEMIRHVRDMVFATRMWDPISRCAPCVAGIDG